MTPLKILHVIGQRPEMTGSGIYLESIIRESEKHGFSNVRLAGVPAGRNHPSKDLQPTDSSYVFFDSEPLNFSVPGMSDVMPYAGKFNRSKGVIWLLKSLMMIKDHDWHLTMAGSGHGPEFDACIDRVSRLGGKVTNHGYVTHGQLSDLMKKAHIQVLPSFFEGLPLVIFEGLASGCRIITTRLSGFDEIFGQARKDTVDLIRLPPLETIDKPYQKDEVYLENALSKSILNMITAVKNNPEIDDPQAEKIASRYTWTRVFDRTLSVYKDAIHQKLHQ
jgi:glycosyltransferase involved in cell wall biosynthesis